MAAHTSSFIDVIKRNQEGFSRYQHMVISPEKSAVVVLFINIFKFVRFYLVLYLADFSGDIMFCERDLVRERDLGHAEAFY